MKKYILLILAIPFLFSSCSDEEPSPEAKITGIYERIIQGNDEWGSNLSDFVSTIHFKIDGTFTMDEVTKDVGGDIVLGYRSYGNGTYTIVEDELTIVYNELFIMGLADANYQPKNDLVPYILETPFFPRLRNIRQL
jgi:hypothetical protein